MWAKQWCLTPLFGVIMSRLRRIAKGGLVYHVMNRANGRLRIFKKMRDFEAFEETLGEGCERFSMRVCGYCVMSNHWHLVLWPRKDGDLSEFMKWLTVTHSHRWHNSHGTVGIGRRVYRMHSRAGCTAYNSLIFHIPSLCPL